MSPGYCWQNVKSIAERSDGDQVRFGKQLRRNFWYKIRIIWGGLAIFAQGWIWVKYEANSSENLNLKLRRSFWQKSGCICAQGRVQVKYEQTFTNANTGPIISTRSSNKRREMKENWRNCQQKHFGVLETFQPARSA